MCKFHWRFASPAARTQETDLLVCLRTPLISGRLRSVVTGANNLDMDMLHHFSDRQQIARHQFVARTETNTHDYDVTQVMHTAAE